MIREDDLFRRFPGRSRSHGCPAWLAGALWTVLVVLGGLAPGSAPAPAPEATSASARLQEFAPPPARPAALVAPTARPPTVVPAVTPAGFLLESEKADGSADGDRRSHDAGGEARLDRRGAARPGLLRTDAPISFPGIAARGGLLSFGPRAPPAHPS